MTGELVEAAAGGEDSVSHLVQTVFVAVEIMVDVDVDTSRLVAFLEMCVFVST